MSQFVIHQDENQVSRRGKSVNTRSNGQNGQKRAVLGVITNQANLRVQPSRAAKPKASDHGFQDENNFSKKSSKTFGQSSQFSVFVDEASKPAVTKPINPAIAAALTAQTRLPLSTVPGSPEIICLDDTSESPMILDLPEEEKKPFDREAVILTAPEYEADIYRYLRETETKNRAKPGYMKRQQDITSSMRSILVDWLVEVSEEYKLHRETLFLAVNYVDRFLSKISVLRGKLQLVGAASMFLAAKYEEIYPPDVSEFVYITDDTYDTKQILRMEHLILKVLAFDVAVPTTNWFCEAFLKSCDADDRLQSLTMCLAELTLIEMDSFLKYVPSITASACLCMARYSLGMEPWPQSLVKKTSYEVGHFVDCLRDIHRMYQAAESHPQQAIQEKYKQDKFQQVFDFTKNPVPHSLTLLSV
ncbi:G2/mitotic-specific cyclin-A-like [Mya arenaria]|uniref:G2/mitotic-specific cyclin-A-like n=1 Tax=Mya arenaria TaxID=6604 RepID=UPI0022E68AA7|nr:G2/mitotic-specific cyclin-A-like [Mya arenaria]XP_052793296.1 G2/mitotic-specific cyclin-A-like [Mya arenaria]